MEKKSKFEKRISWGGQMHIPPMFFYIGLSSVLPRNLWILKSKVGNKKMPFHEEKNKSLGSSIHVFSCIFYGKMARAQFPP